MSSQYRVERTFLLNISLWVDSARLSLSPICVPQHLLRAAAPLAPFTAGGSIYTQNPRYPTHYTPPASKISLSDTSFWTRVVLT